MAPSRAAPGGDLALLGGFRRLGDQAAKVDGTDAEHEHSALAGLDRAITAAARCLALGPLDADDRRLQSMK